MLELHRRVWLTIEVDAAVVDLVVVDRGAHVRDELGYDRIFDSCWYSCEVGAAKPDPAFFLTVVSGVGATPQECLLVDDSESNVLAARSAGLAAEAWTTSEGYPALRKALARHGVVVAEWSP